MRRDKPIISMVFEVYTVWPGQGQLGHYVRHLTPQPITLHPHPSAYRIAKPYAPVAP